MKTPFAMLLLTLPEARPSICTLPPYPGPRRILLRRYYYTPERGCCEVFFCGGWRANGNNFPYRKVCEKVCR